MKAVVHSINRGAPEIIERETPGTGADAILLEPMSVGACHGHVPSCCLSRPGGLGCKEPGGDTPNPN